MPKDIEYDDLTCWDWWNDLDTAEQDRILDKIIFKYWLETQKGD